MKGWEVWILIPVLALFTLVYLLAFKNYTINEWLIGNGIVALGVGCVYITEGIYKKFKK